MTIFSVDDKEVVHWCDHCDEVFPCGNCCYEGGCGYAGCMLEDKPTNKECWCNNGFKHKISNCPVHGKEYSEEERERVKKTFKKRWLEKRKSK